MKKLIGLFVLLFAAISFAQTTTYDGHFAYVDCGTVANSVDETGYVDLSRLGLSKIDSISVTAIGTGELDVDSVDCYVGVNDIPDGLIRYSSTAITFTVTINVAAGASAFEQLYSSNATLLTQEALRGANVIKVITRGATAGNDATDPNKLILVFEAWGTQ